MVFWRRKKQHPSKDPTAIGNLLVETGFCTREDLDRVLRIQEEHPDQLLGEYLVSHGVIDEHTLHIAILKQRALRGTSRGRDVRAFAQAATAKTLAVSGSVDQFVLDFFDKVK